MENIVEVSNIFFKYNDEYVLNDISFNIQKGEIIGVLGHNGAGKTTLFRNIMGLFSPNKGEIHFKENPSHISYLPDNNGIYKNLTVMENLTFRAKLAGINNKEIKDISSKLLKRFNLFKIKNKKGRELSTGLKKRLGLSCALISNSNIIILDEPTNGIDPESLNILIELLVELKEKGYTLLISSHNLEFINKIASKVVILQEGEIVFNEKLENCKENLNEIYLKYTREKEVIDYDVY